MGVPVEFVEMVNEDINRIKECLKSGKDEQMELFREIDGKYQACIVDWGKSMYEYMPQYDLINVSGLYPNEVTENLKIAKAKLTTYKFGMNMKALPETPNTQINISNNNSIQVTITFDTVRSQIGDMTSLSNEETKELLEKIDELETIINSSEKKKTKWQKVAPIIKWLADKSFDVAMTVLPLILKLQG